MLDEIHVYADPQMKIGNLRLIYRRAIGDISKLNAATFPWIVCNNFFCKEIRWLDRFEWKFGFKVKHIIHVTKYVKLNVNCAVYWHVRHKFWSLWNFVYAQLLFVCSPNSRRRHPTTIWILYVGCLFDTYTSIVSEQKRAVMQKRTRTHAHEHTYKRIRTLFGAQRFKTSSPRWFGCLCICIYVCVSAFVTLCVRNTCWCKPTTSQSHFILCSITYLQSVFSMQFD